MSAAAIGSASVAAAAPSRNACAQAPPGRLAQRQRSGDCSRPADTPPSAASASAAPAAAAAAHADDSSEAIARKATASAAAQKLPASIRAVSRRGCRVPQSSCSACVTRSAAEKHATDASPRAEEPATQTSGQPEHAPSATQRHHARAGGGFGGGE